MRTRAHKLITALVSLAFLIAAAAYAVMLLRTDSPGSESVLLEGTVVTPDQVLPDGWVLVQNGRIRIVSESKPDALDAIEVDTAGIIFPGLTDLHNHVLWDVFPRWHPAHPFSNRYEWRADPEHIRQVTAPADYLLGRDFFCDMNTYGELRALAGGTTSILATADAPCIQGLVRNLDYSSGFYGLLEPDSTHIRNEVNIQPTTAPNTIGSVRSFLADSRSEAFFVHLSEGVDAASLDEFYFLQKQGLLTRKTVIVHGVALGPTEFRAMHAAGAALVWSPRSNIELYGKTADIPAALDAGLRVALAPDWAITGSSNLLDELHYAAQWNLNHFSGRLTDQQLVEMVTGIPAQIAGIDDEAGAIREGLYGDLLVIYGDRANPYHALIEARPGDVQLVLIGGQPVFGAPAFMEVFRKTQDLNLVNVDGKPKVVRMPNSSVSFSKLAAELQTALASQGTNLAPLTESR